MTSHAPTNNNPRFQCSIYGESEYTDKPKVQILQWNTMRIILPRVTELTFLSISRKNDFKTYRTLKWRFSMYYKTTAKTPFTCTANCASRDFLREKSMRINMIFTWKILVKFTSNEFCIFSPMNFMWWFFARHHKIILYALNIGVFFLKRLFLTFEWK